MESNSIDVEVKGEAFGSGERIIISDVIENVSDPLDFLKIECLIESNSKEESPVKDPNACDKLRRHNCNICHERFTSKEDLCKHCITHNNINHIFMCSQCSECFVTRTSLNTHKLTHSAKNSLECDICNKPFTSVNSLRSHKRLHQLAECVICHQRFADGKELDEHITDEHKSEEDGYECDVCQKVVSSPAGLKKHKRVHIECDDKGYKRFDDAEEVENHKWKEHDEKGYECDVCQKKVSSLSSLKSHQFLHEVEERIVCKDENKAAPAAVKTLNHTYQLLVECDKCHERFADIKHLDKHKLRKHKSNKESSSLQSHQSEECNICHKRMDGFFLKRHKQNAHSESSFNCEYCCESFNSSVSLNTHKFSHIGGKITFNCNMCDRMFDSTEKRNAHELVHEKRKLINDNTYECPVCQTLFANKINLNYHTKTHHFLKNEVQKKKYKKKDKLYQRRKTRHKIIDINKTKSYECHVCHKRFHHKNNLILHTKSHEMKQPEKIQAVKKRSVDSTFECKLCFKKCPTSQKLKNHVMNHMQGNPYRCSICHKRFAHKTKLIFHLKTRHGDNDSENKHHIDCNFCNEEFTSLSELVLHKQSEHSLQCDICHKRFTTKYVLRDHIRIHTGEMPYECVECHRQFRTLMNLNGHMVVHKQEKRHECTICHEWFTRTSNLKYHLNKQHFFQDFECDVCHEQFTNEYNRDQHTKTQHSEDAVFECDRCLKRFKNKYALKEHERVHTGEKPYECKICHKRFRTGPNLNSHVGSVHKQDRNHECSVCQKRFSRGSNLNRHMRETHKALTAVVGKN